MWRRRWLNLPLLLRLRLLLLRLRLLRLWLRRANMAPPPAAEGAGCSMQIVTTKALSARAL